MANEVTKRVEMSLIPPTKFYVVVDLNSMQAQGPVESLNEAKYKAAELSGYASGPKPVGVFQYVGGVSKEQKPIYWQEADEGQAG